MLHPKSSLDSHSSWHSIELLDDLSGDMTGSGTISATAYGKAVGLNLTGGGDVSLLSIGTSNANLSSSNGDINAIAGDVASYPEVSAPNGGVSITTLSSLSVPSLNAGGDVNIVSGGDLSGYVTSGGNSTVVSLGTLSANVSADGDASLFGMDGLTGIESAGDDLQAVSYGDLGASNLSFHAGHDLTELWTTGDMAGTFTADHAIESVSAYGTIDGTFTAGTITGAQDSAYGQIGSITAWGNIAGKHYRCSLIRVDPIAGHARRARLRIKDLRPGLSDPPTAVVRSTLSKKWLPEG